MAAAANTARKTRKTAMHLAPCAGPRRETNDLNSARTGTLWHGGQLKEGFWCEYERSLDAPDWVASGSHRVLESYGSPIVYGESRRELHS